MSPDAAPGAAELHGTIGMAPGAPPAPWPGALVSGAAAATFASRRLRAAAGWHWREGDGGICARRAPLLWDASAQVWRPWRDDEGGALHAGLLDGTLLPASDEPLVLWRGARVVLRSSMSGSSVLYWTRVEGGWAFAQALPLLDSARHAALDFVGFAEVARFGANYASRTILAGLQRIPFGHELVIEGGTPALRAYARLHSDPTLTDPARAEETIGERLAALAALLPDRRHAMYSGGVDSSLLAAVLLRAPGETVGVNLALRPDDPEVVVAQRIADQLGLPVVRGLLEADASDVEATVGSYAAPTLDFSVLPTHLVGQLARADGATTLVDGTGGDAWFGFGALANEPVWRHIHHAFPLRRVAARAYGVLALAHDHRAWTPLKAMARAPRRGDAALAHLCASPLYDVVWRLPSDAWDAAEREVAATLDALLGAHEQAPWQRMVAVDGAFIASGAFAAKSGQWSLARAQATVYPFLTPGLVDVARHLSRELMLRGREAKPLLKDLAIHLGIRREDIYRKKAGFQPPLAALMQRDAVRTSLQRRLAGPHELDALVTAHGRRIIRAMLHSGARPSIHMLYPFWNMLSMQLWLDQLRSGAAAHRWCA